MNDPKNNDLKKKADQEMTAYNGNHSKRKTGIVRKAAGLLLGLTVLISTLLPAGQAYAEEAWPSPGDVTSEAACVIDINSGTVLYEKNANEQHYPASITKIMTALVAAEHSSMDEKVTFSAKAVYENENGSSSIARDLGEEMTMEQCMYGMLLESANECAYAIAEHVGKGDASKFVTMMNEKAKSLGCKNTYFSNPNGLPDDTHYTTAYDMALIAAAAYKNPVVAQIVGTKQYTIPPTNKHVDPTPLNNHHQMLNFYQTSRWLYDYCVGGKTGYTTAANNTLVTYAKKDNMLLACVVMNCVSPSQYQDTINLFNYFFDNYTEYSLKDAIDLSQTGKTGVLGEDSSFLKIGDGSVILPKGVDLSQAKSKITKASDKGKNIEGRLEYTYAGRNVGGADLISATKDSDIYPFHNVSAKDGGSSVKYIRIDFKIIAGFIAAVVLCILLIYAIRKQVKKYRERHPKRAKVYERDYSAYKKIKSNDSVKKRNKGKEES